MILTRLKAKLPRHLSYPVGAEAISEALADEPHVASLSVTFWDQAVWPASEFRRLLNERLPYRIMIVEFRPERGPGLIGSAAMIEDGWYDERWELRVYPVLAEFRSTANRLLREQGLPAVSRWLRSSRRAGWLTVPQWVESVFDPTKDALAVREGSGV